MKTALIHDWVVAQGGAENCLEVFHRLYPEASLYTLLYNEATVAALGFDVEKVHASMLQGYRKIQQRYRFFLPLFPYAIEQFDLSDYDLILSSSHCVAKGVLTRSDQLHICYCHTPVRYAWDLTHSVLRVHRMEKGINAHLIRLVLHYLRIWDEHSTNRVDYFIASSRYTAQRIWRVYRREAEVIYPPVDVKNFPLQTKKGDYFIFVARLVPFKKADILIKAFGEMGLPLKVVGDGPTWEQCRQLAKDNVEMLGYKNGSELADLMGRARALVMAADEDFGIVPVEAQACGTPVIAFGRGGVRETVIPATGSNWHEATGLFFQEQTIPAIKSAVEQFLQWEGNFDHRMISENAQRFSQDRFYREIEAYVDQVSEGRFS